MSRRVSPRAGFTLVEILATTFIVALLVAMLIPAVNGARSRAMSAACVANLRQCGVVLMQYAQDNRQEIPTRWRQGSKWYGWNSFLQKTGYLEMTLKTKIPIGRRIYSCPLSYRDIVNTANTDVQAYGINIDAWGATGRLAEVDMGEKSYLDDSGVTYSVQTLRLSALSHPGSFVLLADSYDKWLHDNTTGSPDTQKAVFGEPSSNLWMRHDGGLNALLADSHVERLTPNNIQLFLSPSMPGGYHE